MHAYIAESAVHVACYGVSEPAILLCTTALRELFGSQAPQRHPRTMADINEIAKQVSLNAVIVADNSSRVRAMRN